MTVCCSVSRTANFRKGRGLDRTRGSYKALVTEVQLCILRGELGVPQKMRAGPRRPAAPSFLEGPSGDELAAPSPGPEREIYLGMSYSGTLGESLKTWCPRAGRNCG